MTKLHQVYTDFSAGELDELALMRTDTEAFKHGAAKVRNAFILNTGGATNRPGTSLEASPGTDKIRLEPFEFDSGEQYLCAFYNGGLKIYDASDSSLVQTITTGIPWLLADLFELVITQVADTMLVFHQSFIPQKITRTAADTFVRADFAFDTRYKIATPKQPYFKYADEDVTIVPSDWRTGTITLTASSSVFTSDHVGTYIQFESVILKITAYTSGTSVSATLEDDDSGQGYIYGEMVTDPFETIPDSPRVIVTHPNHGMSVDDDVAFENATGPVDSAGSEMYDGINVSGVFNIEEIIDDDHYVIVAGMEAPTASSWYTGTWSEGAALEKDSTIMRLFDGISTLDYFEPKYNYDIEVEPTSGYGNITNHYHMPGLRMLWQHTTGGMSGTDGARAMRLSTSPTNVREPYYQDHATNNIQTVTTEKVVFGGSNVRWIPVNAPSRNWKEQVFSDVNGYPAAGVFAHNRLWLASTPADPALIVSSHIGDFFNFDVGSGLDSESIQFQITGEEGMAEIRNFSADENLQIFTRNGEYFVDQQNLTPAAFKLNNQTSFGSGYVKPIRFDGGTVFAQGSGKAIREFMYSDAQAAYGASNLSLLVPHLISNPADMAAIKGTASRPEQYIAVVNDDGTLAVFFSNRTERVAAWSLWTITDDNDAQINIESVCEINNQLWLSVLKDSNRYLCKLSADETDYLDLMESHSGASSDTWTVDAAFTNDTVDVVVDGVYSEQVTASTTTITLSAAQTALKTGFRFTPQLRTLPPTISLPTGPRFGMVKGIGQTTVHFNGTQSATVNGHSLSNNRNISDDAAVSGEVTGKRQFNLLGYDRDPYVEITQTSPGVLRVLGVQMGVLI